MRRWMPLLLVMASACGLRAEPPSLPFDLPAISVEAWNLPSLASMEPPSWLQRGPVAATLGAGRPEGATDSARRAVRVHVPPGAESAGSHLPLLYIEEGSALFFPSGAGDASLAVVPRPSELVSLLRRPDIVIVTVDD
ncbi:hypothetical protein ACLESO_36095 [Pyxidicoccus sp. 3LG]